MIVLAIFNAICIIAIVAWFVKAVVIVPDGCVFIVERLGRFRKVIQPGAHILVPLIDRISYKHTIQEQTAEVPMQYARTKDGAFVGISGALHFSVVDAYKASYAIGNHLFCTVSEFGDVLRTLICGLTLDECLRDGEDCVVAGAIERINRTAGDWGVRIDRFATSGFTVDDQLRTVINKIRRFECESQTMIAESDRVRRQRVSDAVAEAEIARTRAICQRDQMVALAQARAHAISISSAADARNLREVLRLWSSQQDETL